METVVEDLNSFYRGKKVFVTGHTGFKGAWFVTWLHQLGAVVKGYALAPDNDRSLYNIVAPQIVIESEIGDILDKEKLTASIASFQPDIVFHLAAQALVRRSYQIPSDTFNVNVVGTANVLEAVHYLPGKCSVVVITTDKVYDNKEQNYHYKETDVLGGYDPYSASKAAAELVVSSFRNSFFHTGKYSFHQKAIASARAGNVIGGGDWNEDRIIPDIIKALESGINISVRNPNAVRPWQLVLEPLFGYLLLGMHLHNEPSAFSEAYNFGPLPDDHVPVKKLVEIAFKYWGSGEWNDNSSTAQPHEAGLLQLDVEKAMTQLKWQPKLKSEDAIAWTIDWYKQHVESAYAFTLEQIKKFQQL